jgi:hypothetical protein
MSEDLKRRVKLQELVDDWVRNKLPYPKFRALKNDWSEWKMHHRNRRQKGSRVERAMVDLLNLVPVCLRSVYR